MRNKINPIDTENGKFKDGDPLSGEYGTIVKAKWLNDVQDALRTNQGEILTVLKNAGIQVNSADETQLWQALQLFAGQAESIEALRAFEPIRDRQLVYLKSYYATGAQGGGFFMADFSDVTTTDDGGTVVVTPNGKRWKRVYSSPAVGNVPNLESGELEFTLKRVGVSPGNVVQTFVIDDRNGKIYTNHVGNTGGTNTYFCRYDYRTHTTTKTADSSMDGVAIAGHQGLAIEYVESGVKLWTSAGKSIKNSGQYVIRFDYEADGTLTQYETFRLFGDEFQTTGQSVTPCISHDQKFLIARGRLKSTEQSVLRVWDLSIFTQSGDYSQQYLHQFGTDMMTVDQPDVYAMQGIACDGSVIVCQYGMAQTTINKALLVYSLDGRLLAKNMNCTIGKDNALADTGDHWEPEGVFFALNQQGNLALYHCINSGAGGKRNVRLYSSHSITAEFKSLDDGKAAIFVNASHDIGIPNGQVLKIAEEQSDGSLVDFATLEKRGFTFTKGDKTALMKMAADNTRSYVEFRVNNTLANGAGFNLYGKDDPSNPHRAIFYAGGKSVLTLDGDFVKLGSGQQYIQMNKSGLAMHYDNNAFSIMRSESDGRDIVFFRVNGSENNGAWLNLYGANDNAQAHKAIISAGNNGARLTLESDVATFSKTIDTPVLNAKRVEVIVSDTSQPQFVVGNSLREGVFQVSSSGNLGIWDRTLQRWSVVSDSNGCTQLGYDPGESANSREIATTKWVRNRIKVLTGTIAHGGTIPLPSGFTQDQCKWLAFPKKINDDVTDSDIHYFEVYAGADRVVTCLIEGKVSPTSTAQYMIIGIK